MYLLICPQSSAFGLFAFASLVVEILDEILELSSFWQNMVQLYGHYPLPPPPTLVLTMLIIVLFWYDMCCRFTQAGRSFFSLTDKPLMDIGNGMAVWSGFNMSIRPNMWGHHVVLNSKTVWHLYTLDQGYSEGVGRVYFSNCKCHVTIYTLPSTYPWVKLTMYVRRPP